MSDPDWDIFPDSLVQSTTAPPHAGNRNIRGPISLAGPGPPSTLRRLCPLCQNTQTSQTQALVSFQNNVKLRLLVQFRWKSRPLP